MYKNKGYYEVYSGGDHLEPGGKITIDHSISFIPTGADISALVTLPLETLQARRDGSAAAEKVIFENLRGAAEAWEAQASQTMLLDKAMEYLSAPSVDHTANEWRPDRSGDGRIISNMVYKMWYCMNEETRYNYETKEHIPIAWHLTWDVWTNGPLDGCDRIAGQFRKRFTDKAAMEKYLQGRIKAYAHLFTGISPPIPKEFEQYFTVNGQLLPGYRVKGQAAKQSECSADVITGGDAKTENRPSAIGRLAAAKETVAQKDASKADAPKEKKREPEL